MALTAILIAATATSILSFISAWRARFLSTGDSSVFTIPVAAGFWGWVGYLAFRDPVHLEPVAVAVALASTVIYLGVLYTWAWWLFNHAEKRTAEDAGAQLLLLLLGLGLCIQGDGDSSWPAIAISLAVVAVYSVSAADWIRWLTFRAGRRQEYSIS